MRVIYLCTFIICSKFKLVVDVVFLLFCYINVQMANDYGMFVYC